MERLRGMALPMAQAHGLRGPSVLPRPWPLPMEHLRGMVDPVGRGPQVRGATSRGKSVNGGRPFWAGAA